MVSYGFFQTNINLALDARWFPTSFPDLEQLWVLLHDVHEYVVDVAPKLEVHLLLVAERGADLKFKFGNYLFLLYYMGSQCYAVNS